MKLDHQDLIYTDGSNNGDIISSTAAFRQLGVPSASSIINTKANTMLVPLKILVSSDKNKFVMCSDFLFCVLTTEGCKTQKPFP